jgi:hypothetical protein
MQKRKKKNQGCESASSKKMMPFTDPNSTVGTNLIIVLERAGSDSF